MLNTLPNVREFYFPFFTLILWQTIIVGSMLVRRITAVSKKEVSPKFFKTYHDTTGVPLGLLAHSNNYNNLFQIPSSFFLLCLFMLMLGIQDPWALPITWLFVFSRIVHSLIHISTNKLILRMTSFSVGIALLLLLAFRILLQIY